ncbi:MAG: 30S ribosomal protein S3 [Patescibacteria group bacterium]|nr:30S ribosomal protein S3 [Patescibacteria group bacterium]
MGQKINPKIFRLGILYNWDSRWFFSNKALYRKNLLLDIKLREAIFKNYAYASVTQVEIERAINKITLIIHSVKPGMIIGQGGKRLEELKKFIAKTLNIDNKSKEIKIDIKIEPVKKPYLNANFVAQTIASKLIKNFPHRSVVHNAMDRVMEAGAKGVKIQLGGRVAGAEISRREKYFQGKVSTSTIRANIDFARFPALTKSGYVGIKVWICK